MQFHYAIMKLQFSLIAACGSIAFIAVQSRTVTRRQRWHSTASIGVGVALCFVVSIGKTACCRPKYCNRSSYWSRCDGRHASDNPTQSAC